MSQQVLPLLPGDAVAIGPLAGLVQTEAGGVVFVCGLATFAFTDDDVLGRRLAAVQLVETKIASVGAVTAGFGITQATLWRWRQAFTAQGVAGLVPAKVGPKGPSKLTEEVIARIQALDADGLTLAAVAEQTGVSTATVRVALGRKAGSWTGEAQPAPDDAGPDTGEEVFPERAESGHEEVADDEKVEHGGSHTLPVLPVPVPRTGERALARAGLLSEAPVVFTPGAHLPLAGLLLVLPTLESTGLLVAFESVYARLRDGFYGLVSIILTMLFLALLRDPRAEGATRMGPVDLGRLLGLDRAPEVKTLRRKLGELAAHRRGADLQAALAAAHAAARPDALGFLHVDGHTRVYTGTRDLPKTHVARLHMIAHATAETWIADADADPVLVVPGKPGASLAAELVRIIPDLRAIIGQQQRATVIFDRGGWSPVCFQQLIEAGLDILTYRKGGFDQLGQDAFTEQVFTDPDGTEHVYILAETTVHLPLADGEGGSITLRQIHKRTQTGGQVPVLTSRTDLGAAEVCWRLAGRWRQENYFRYARAHFALDVLDSYADQADDLDRAVPNPAKKHATATVDQARAGLATAHADLSRAIDEAASRARRPGGRGTATVEAAPVHALAAAQDRFAEAKTDRRGTPSHLPLRQVRPTARLLQEETKLVTHAIRMAADNAESTLARMLAPHYARADDEARALIREAFTLPGDIHVDDTHLHVRLDPATAPRRSRAIHALCQQLTATQTTYPGTNLTITYALKNQPDHS